MPPSPPTPAEKFAMLLLWLGKAVDSRSLVGLLARPLAVLILNRIREINQRFARLAARVAAGTYVPRRSTPRPHVERKPRRPNPLPQGPIWLIKLVPEAAASASQFRLLLTDPEMAALIEAASAPMRRPLRSLCRMLGVEPPPILAPPPAPERKTRPPKPERPPAAKPVKVREKKPRYVFGLRYPPPFPDPA